MYWTARKVKPLVLALALTALAATGAGCRRAERASETQAGAAAAGEPAETGAAEMTEAAAALPDPDRQILDFIAGGEPGASLELTDTKWGQLVTVTVGDAYFSALGEVGRRATITDLMGSLTFDISVVEINNEWRYAPNVLAPVKNG